MIAVFGILAIVVGFFVLVWLPFVVIGGGLAKNSMAQVIVGLIIFVPLWLLVADQMMPKRDIWIECNLPGIEMCARRATPIFGFVSR